MEIVLMAVKIQISMTWLEKAQQYSTRVSKAWCNNVDKFLETTINKNRDFMASKAMGYNVNEYKLLVVKTVQRFNMCILKSNVTKIYGTVCSPTYKSEEVYFELRVDTWLFSTWTLYTRLL